MPDTVTIPRELLQEAGEIIEAMATWFRNQPLGCPPAGTAQLQARIRKVLAAGVKGCQRCGGDGSLPNHPSLIEPTRECPDCKGTGYAAGVTAVAPPKLTVWFGSMPESNGRTNWTAILHRGDMSESHTIDRSQYPGRVRYAADRVRWLLGELEKAPFILDYDGDERTPCHLCGGSGEKDGKPCWGLNFDGTVHDATPGVTDKGHETFPAQTPTGKDQ